MTEVVSKEVAEKEVTAWLDYKKIKAPQREMNKVHIEMLVDALVYGEISINPAKEYAITQKLNFPISELDLSELVFKSRVSLGELQRATAANPKDAFTPTIAVLTGKPVSHLQKLDSEDCKVGHAISVFF